MADEVNGNDCNDERRDINDADVLLTPVEAAQLIGVSSKELSLLTAAREVPVALLGEDERFRIPDIRRFIERRRKGPSAFDNQDHYRAHLERAKEYGFRSMYPTIREELEVFAKVYPGRAYSIAAQLGVTLLDAQRLGIVRQPEDGRDCDAEIGPTTLFGGGSV